MELEKFNLHFISNSITSLTFYWIFVICWDISFDFYQLNAAPASDNANKLNVKL